MKFLEKTFETSVMKYGNLDLEVNGLMFCGFLSGFLLWKE
jgi:hypothetical protein